MATLNPWQFKSRPNIRTPRDYPEWRVIDRLRAYEVEKNKNLGVQGVQVQAFILLGKLHDYIAHARYELETLLGTSLCQEHCCCLHSTPFVTRLEAEYIISRNGYYSHLIGIAEAWLYAPHEEAPSFPKDIPAIAGGKRAPLQVAQHVVKEMRALANLQSPFLFAEKATRLERIVSGPWAKTSFASGTSLVHAENWDLLEDTQPLMCAVSGVFTLPPPSCTRRLGLGESSSVRSIADPGTIKQGYDELQKLYDKAPEKAMYGFLPTMVSLAANPVRFKEMAASGKVALAKLAISQGKFPFKLWEVENVAAAERKVSSSSSAYSGGTRGS